MIWATVSSWSCFCWLYRASPSCQNLIRVSKVLTKKGMVWAVFLQFLHSVGEIISCVLLLMLRSHFSGVQLCVTPETAAHQDPPSLGFSRQEHWSGLPFPSPMHESGKRKWSRSVMSDSLWPYGLQLTRLCRPWDSSGKGTRMGCHCLLPYHVYLLLRDTKQKYS